MVLDYAFLTYYEVSLQHWEHLCECKPQKRRLLFRHTLAELNDMVLITDKSNHEEAAKKIRGQLLSSNDPSALSKKVLIITLIQYRTLFWSVFLFLLFHLIPLFSGPVNIRTCFMDPLLDSIQCSAFLCLLF